jgi:hypothetical protein
MCPEMTDGSHPRQRARFRRPAAGADVPEARLEGLLGLLPPAPEPLVRRVLELPQLDAALARLERRLDAPADVAAALRDVGLEPDDDRLQMLGQLRRQGLGHGKKTRASPYVR